MIQQPAEAGLSVLNAALGAAKIINNADSLVAYTQVARVEPITILDRSVMFHEVTPEVMQSLLSIFAGYYLQAWDLSANINGVDVIRQLEKLNPSRDVLNNLGLESLNDMEHKLPSLARMNVSLEASDDSVKQSRESVNLSVGKLLQVEVRTGDGPKGNSTVKIPVAIRLMVHPVAPDSLINILALGAKDQSTSERYHQWKAGNLSFFRDLVMCQDLIDEHKKNLREDTSGLFEAITHRRTGNMISSILSQNLSVASASNIAVIGQDTATQLEAHLGSPLSKYATRKKIFDKTYMMLLAVIEPDWTRVTIYTRGIHESSSIDFRDLKAGGTAKGPDVADILSAYKAGSSMSL